ncbi:DNA topology modulation protein [Ornithinibacillus massiliensis]|uniref:DNA topology modulation protein n=1 Tax=Ornithinibacillus massiliensis TaxID=1944633 RepID=A0ABS5ME47_9BACI|nr:DNA topology modulation protein [Ornithinibacillus massiliensis]MBS3680609.1 DNA topology modulation protein [Ornithinibacillus massiliensis]
MKKITIIGNPGAGKSTLARQLGDKLNIPVYHMDSLYWKPNWQPSEDTELIQKHDEILKQDSWIIDGNYSATLPKRFADADTIIFLNYPTLRTLYGITKRRIQYRNRTRPDMAEGCHERLNLDFIRWTKDYNKNKAPKMYKRLANLTNKDIHIFKNRKQLTDWLQQKLPN